MPVAKNESSKSAAAAVSVNDSADLIIAANTGRRSVLIQNLGAADAYLGKANTVTTSTGIKLASGAILADDDSTDAWYGITASGTADIRVVEVS